MKPLRDFLNSLPTDEQLAFAERCKTSLGYLRKAISTGQNLQDALCTRIEFESNSAVCCEQLRPDLPWLRLTDACWPNPKGRPVIDHGSKAEVGAGETAKAA